MHALFLNGSLKDAKRASQTEDVARMLLSYLRGKGVLTMIMRLADWKMKQGTMANGGKGDQYPDIEKRMIHADMLIFGTPAVNGGHTSVLQRLFERMGNCQKPSPWKDKPAGVVVPGLHSDVAMKVADSIVTLGFWIPPAFWVHNTNVEQLGDGLLDRVGGKDA